jgi:hypothetical protein
MEFKPNSPFASEDSTTGFENLSPPLLIEEDYTTFDSPFDDEASASVPSEMQLSD